MKYLYSILLIIITTVSYSFWSSYCIEKKMNQVELDMTPDNVVRIFGHPDLVEHNTQSGGSSRWTKESSTKESCSPPMKLVVYYYPITGFQLRFEDAVYFYFGKNDKLCRFFRSSL